MRALIRSVLGLVVLLWLGVQLVSALRVVFSSVLGFVVVGMVLATSMTLVMLTAWARLAHPWVWWRAFGAHAAALRMLWTWRATCEGMGLSIPAKRTSGYALVNGGSGRGRQNRGGVIVKGEPLRLVAPHKVGVRVSRCGLVVTVRMHPGQVPAAWDKAAEAFGHQWRVHRVRCESKRPGFITLTGLGFDPLRFPPKPRSPLEGTSGDPVAGAGPNGPMPAGGPVLEGLELAVVPDILVVLMGVREDGEPWSLNLKLRPHYLVVGATLSGKSTLTVRLMSELCPRPVALVGIDLKGGMELSPFGPRLSALAVTQAEAAAALDALVELLKTRAMRCRLHAARSIWELPEDIRPEPILVVVDEVAELFLAADKEGKEQAGRCVLGLVRLGQLGASLGIHLWVSGQRFGSDLGPGATLVRAQLAGRICHRVTDKETAGMTLASLPPEALTEALNIADDLPGVAVVGDDSGAWGLARSHRTAMADAAATARQFAQLRVDLPDVTAAVERARVGGGDW